MFVGCPTKSWEFKPINIIASNLYFRLDLTEEKKYSLNDATKEILNSIDDIIYVKVYLNGDLPAGFIRLKNSCQETLDEFRNQNKGPNELFYI